MAEERQVIEGRRLEPHEMGNEDVFHPFPLAASAPLGSLDTFMGDLKPLPILSYMDKIRIWGETAKNATRDSDPLSGHLDTVSGDIAPDEEFAWAGGDKATAGGEFPPDMAGAFNNEVFIEITRGRFNVWTGVDALSSSVSLNDFWSGIQVGGVFGARILYDQFTNRFVHIAIDRQDDVFGPTNKILFAISEAGDHTVWFRTSLLAGVAPFTGATTNYVQLGVDDLGYYISADLDTLGLSSVWVIDAGPLATLPPTTIPPVPGSGLGVVTVFHFGPTNGVVGMIPVHTWLQNEASFGTEYFIGTPTPGSGDWPAFRMFEVTGPRSAPIFASTGLLPTDPYFPAPLSPAFGSTPDIRDGVGDYRLRNAVYRLDDRLQPTGSIWTCMSSISGGRAAPKWFELDPVAPFDSGSVRQSGLVDDPTFYYFNPSIMVNKSGGAMMGFSGSWGLSFVGAYYTGRLPTDPPDTMGPVVLAKGGEAAYINLDPSSFNIWGRYSAPVLEPFGEELFLTMQEYAKSPANTWGSWIAGLEFLTRSLAVTISPTAAQTAGATVDQLPVPPYFQGDDVILTANDVTGDWIFDHWENDLTGTANPDTITMDFVRVVDAIYTQVEYTIDTTVLPAEAVVAGATLTLDSGPYHLNDVIQATANNSGGWTFDHWTGDLSGSVNPDNLTIDGNKDITAVFIGPTVDITIEPAQAESDGATVDTVPSPPFALDAIVELTANAPLLWRFDHWEGDLSGNENPIDIVMDGPKTVTAVFDGKFHPADVRDPLAGGDPNDPNPDFKNEISEAINYYIAWLTSTPWPAGGPSPPSIAHAISGYILFLQNDGRYYHVPSAFEPNDAWLTGGMVVTPPDDICESGPPGGPFTGERIYTITNLTTGTIDYSVEKSAVWVSLDGGDGPVAGSLATLASVQVTVSIDSDADALLAGGHADVVRFFNLTDGTGDTTRLVKLDVAGTTVPPTTVPAPPTTTAPAPPTTTAPPAPTFPPFPTFPPPTKWLQEPEFAAPGMAIKVDQELGDYIIADDFVCNANDRIIAITIWGAFKGDVIGAPSFELSFWHDIPAESSPFGHSVPGALAWTKSFNSSEYVVTPEPTGTDWWWDPDAPVGPGNPSLATGTTMDFKYTFDIDLDQAFLQTGESETPVIYWLSVRAIGASYEFGWKTRLFGENFNDNAVFAETTVPVPASWAEFTYPTGHPGAGAPLDMAFMLESTTDQPTTVPPTAPPPPEDFLATWFDDAITTAPGTAPPFERSHLEFGGSFLPSMPADFFGPGSDPFAGQFDLEGVPLDPENLGDTSTVMQRSADPVLPGDPPSTVGVVDIELVELHLQSVEPIIVTESGGGNPTPWDVDVTLSPSPPPPTGTLTATKTHNNGGTFDSTLFVQLLFTFTEVGNPSNTVVFDTVGFTPVPLSSTGSFVHTLDPGVWGGYIGLIDQTGRQWFPTVNETSPGNTNSQEPDPLEMETSFDGGQSVRHVVCLPEPIPVFGKDYVQLPDIANPTTPTGIDIKCSDLTLGGDPDPVIVADEWLCPGSGPITNITIWMSRLDDDEPTPIVSIELSIHSNVSDGGSGFPVPGPVVWTKTFSAAEFTRTPFAVVSNGEWWLDLPSGSPIHPGDTVVELVDFPVPFGEEFVQTFGETYWLSVRIHVAPGLPTTQAGWKTRDPGDGFSGEFAVWALSAGAPTPGSWTPLLYPVTHPLASAPIDMSFVVFTPPVPPTAPPTTGPPP